MNDYILLMRGGAAGTNDSGAGWESYLAKLRQSGQFSGGSAIGSGVCVSKRGAAPDITADLSGYLKVQATSIEDAKKLLAGNPVFEAGGVVEIRELPRTG